ncbi:hypothetical protein TIFTF001_036258 [Ficus carica]|uniref:BURP domain-containing protein n=1 Tax=Ficus carica TaxID=3494 RepID=A0AA88E3Y2_FICCA|nr:hypothetical protein TIFTF001_036258 [Ficus carica]
MGFGVPQQRILLLQYVLLAFLLSHVSVAWRVRVEINQLLVDETSDLKRDGTDDHRDNHVHQLGMTSDAEHRDNPSSFHIDDSTKTSLFFFSPKDLKAGNRIPLYFSKKLAWTSKLLPRDEADSIPFSLKELPSLLKLFSIAQGSKQAEAMEDTLRMCEDPPLKGETKFCATSLESMLDFTLRVFGIGYSDHDNYPTFLTSTFHSTSESESIVSFQNYTILETPKAILTSQMVGCHAMPYPYTVFHCHIKEGRSNVYKILFGGENGDTLDAFAACHLDTSQWDHSHVSFRILGAEPGDPVCHIFPPHGNLLWIHKPTTSI